MSDERMPILIRAYHEVRMRELEQQREAMIEWLRTDRSFSEKGAAACVDNFLRTMRYVLTQTGELPPR